MKFAIEIQDMSQAELAAVTAFLTSMGAKPVAATSKTVAELAALTGAAPSNGIPAPTPAAAPQVVASPASTGIPAPTPAAAPQVVASPVAGELDNRGVPHNPTFHAETKRKNNDGSWAKRKGVDKDACAAYEAGFIGNKQPAPAPVSAPAAAPTAAELNAQFAPHLVTPPAADPFAAPPATPAPPAPTPPAKPAVAEVTYAEWYALYMSLLTAGKISPEQYTAIAEKYGAIENAMKFMDDADARANSYAELMTFAG